MPRIKRARAASRAVGHLGGRPRTILPASPIFPAAILVEEDLSSAQMMRISQEARESDSGMVCLDNFIKQCTKNESRNPIKFST